ncbi:MAG: adenylyltransferase/cytidyltransferase family protein [Clostridia bacterium]|nr:adenylyltransferase/cytidyltransferase family protein [Clostridia bacterium]MBQ6961341.1 adenylyltransferase/cytidyltransferase family protein [Clostridia bacterium]
MKNVVYVGSFDPAHNGHLNTYRKASCILNERIKICICYNELKPQGMFSIDERIAIAKALFHTNDICSFKNYYEIKQLIESSDLIVRGYRKTDENAEKEYSAKLLSYLGLQELKDRLFFVDIDEEYESVSSSLIREYAKTDINSISQFLNEESFRIAKHILLNNR